MNVMIIIWLAIYCIIDLKNVMYFFATLEK